MSIAESSEEQAEPDACAFCGSILRQESDDPWFFLDASWGSEGAWADDNWVFCNQAHAAGFLQTTTLRDPQPVTISATHESRFGWLGSAAFVMIVLLNLAIYILGFVTWLRWVWR